MLQNKADSTVLRPYFCSYFCLVCGGWGLEMIPHWKQSDTFGPKLGYKLVSGMEFPGLATRVIGQLVADVWDRDV